MRSSSPWVLAPALGGEPGFRTASAHADEAKRARSLGRAPRPNT